MIDFNASTQCRNWFFKDQPEKLHEIGQLKYQKFQAAVRQHFQMQGQLTAEQIENKLKEFLLKLELEEKVLGTFIDRLAIKSMNFDENLLATAMAYFQRYYLNQTLFQQHPEKIAKVQNACLFLATKVNEVNFTSDKFCELMQLDPMTAELTQYES